ncbi:glutathione synthase [Suttonella ornithocola]|uniref:Glutathione synthetase n=1 Tax=Suttonella ornithocola TaxID=279832 RepID=A0A380MP95_9GAMM|nr:glutathione synthase [Suttonella ornithocola]SUO94440.1 Glutathione synthetase [Suttonella ornithocola]
MQTVAVLMDDIDEIKPYKDTTFALMLTAQARGMTVKIFNQADWSVRDGMVKAYVRTIECFDREEDYYRICNEEEIDLSTVDVVLQRKDPPFNLRYIYDSYMLDLLVEQGVTVINPPSALRNINEKFAIAQVPECTPPTLITKSREDILDFLRTHKEAVLKPLDGMGGMGIFKLTLGDKNTTAILDAMNPDGNETLMVQGFLPKVTEGDKRILIIDGEAIDHGLARLPKDGEFRANLAAGGRGVVQPLTQREYELVEHVKPIIQREGLFLVGLDVIGGYITEINVTSPTCLREIAAATGQNLAEHFWEKLEKKLSN